MKILDLPLKKKWYEMIESGEKTEEYREYKDYWRKRLIYLDTLRLKPYTHVRFRYGYTKRTMLFKIDSITVDVGNPDWGAPFYPVFIIKFHKEVMAQYIEKSALVAEIEKRIKEIDEIGTYLSPKGVLTNLLCHLDTIEAKEVGLDKEARHYLLHEHKSPLSTVMHQADLHTEMQYHEDIENAFKAGFELGLKTKGGE